MGVYRRVLPLQGEESDRRSQEGSAIRESRVKTRSVGWGQTSKGRKGERVEMGESGYYVSQTARPVILKWIDTR